MPNKILQYSYRTIRKGYVIHDIKNDEFLETINKKLRGYDKKAYAEKALVRIAKSAGRNKEEFEVLNCELLVFKDK